MFAAWCILISMSLLPLPLNGIMNGMILYGLMSNFALKAAKPQLGDRITTPLPAMATGLGIILLVSGLIMMGVMGKVPAHLSWMTSAGATLIVYTQGRPYYEKLKRR